MSKLNGPDQKKRSSGDGFTTFDDEKKGNATFIMFPFRNKRTLSARNRAQCAGIVQIQKNIYGNRSKRVFIKLC